MNPMNHDSCSMKQVANEAAVRAGKPGAFAFEAVTEGDVTYQRMWVHLPSGFVGAFNLEPGPKSNPFVWPWNRSTTKPTIHKPVRLRAQWCGRIKGGRMISDPAPEEVVQPTAQMPLPPPSASVRAAVKKATRSIRK